MITTNSKKLKTTAASSCVLKLLGRKLVFVHIHKAKAKSAREKLKHEEQRKRNTTKLFPAESAHRD